MRVGRDQLYAEVWAEPMTTVAQRYGVSSSYLARICERLKVPRPPRGYWRRRAVGIEVEPEPLPEAQTGDELEWVRDGSTAPKISKLIPDRAREAEPRQKERAVQPQRRRRVAEARSPSAEDDAAREARIHAEVASWRLARDIRAFVAEVRQMVEDADCAITAGGRLDASLEWALAYAERVDPLARLRGDILRVVSERQAGHGAESAAAASGGSGGGGKDDDGNDDCGRAEVGPRGGRSPAVSE